MLKVIKTDSNRNPIVKSGKLVFIYAAEAAAQIIDSTIRVQLKEYRYDQTKGIEYFGNAFVGNPNFQLFKNQVKTQVEALPFVEKITNFSYSLDDSVLSYSMTVKTIYGTTTVNS